MPALKGFAHKNKKRNDRKIINPKQINLKEFGAVLVIMPDKNADFITAVPALDALKEALPPEGKITAIVSRNTINLAKACVSIDSAVMVNVSNPASFLCAYGRLFKSKHQMLINFNGVSAMGLVVGMISRAAAKISYAPKKKAAFYNKIYNLHLHTINEPQHKIVKYLSLVRFIGANSYDFAPKLKLLEEDKKFACEFFAKNNISDSDAVVGIHPSLFDKEKRWAINKYAQLAKLLSEKYGIKVIAVHHPTEKAAFNEFMHVSRNCAISIGTYDYVKMTAVARYMSCFVCNESDFMHIFSPFTRILAIWGPTDPEVNKPAGTGHQVLRAADKRADSVPVSTLTELISGLTGRQ